MKKVDKSDLIAAYKAIEEKNHKMFTEIFASLKDYDKNDIKGLFIHSIHMRFKTGINLILESNLLHSFWLELPLHAAIHVGDLETVEALVLRGTRLDYNGEIRFALEKKKWDVAKFLISKGFKYNHNLCLPMCVECPELVEFFIKKAADDIYIQSAFCEAVKKRCKQSVEILLNHGATPTPDLVPRMIEMGVGIFAL
jgi:hypothetical protein